MRKHKRSIALACIMAFTLVACSIKALNTSAVLIDETGSLFLQLGRDFNTMCTNPVNPTPELLQDCAEWKGFVPTFQREYPLAVASWEALAQCQIDEAQMPTGRDCGSQTEIINVVAALKNLLLQFALRLV